MYPENAERLMVLIDKEKGILTRSSEFTDNEPQIHIQEVSYPVKLVDVLKIHDFRYIQKVKSKVS